MESTALSGERNIAVAHLDRKETVYIGASEGHSMAADWEEGWCIPWKTPVLPAADIAAYLKD